MTTPLPDPQGPYPQTPSVQGQWTQPPLPGQYSQPGQPPYPQAPYLEQPTPGGRSTLGLVSVILGAIPLLLTLISPFATLAAASGDNYAAIGIVNALLNGIAFVLGAAALITGLIAIFRPGQRKALAGIGTGLGIAATWGALSGFLYPVVMQLGGY